MCRFEAKNQELKRAAKNSNFKDVALAVARYWIHRSDRRLRDGDATKASTYFTQKSELRSDSNWQISSRLEATQILSMMSGGARSAADGVHTELTYHSEIHHAGVLLTEQSWVAVTISKMASLIMQVTSIVSLAQTGKAANGDIDERIFFIHGRAYSYNRRVDGRCFLQEDACRVPYARKQDLKDPNFYSMETVALHRCSITVLAPFPSHGVYYFVELP